MGLAVAALLAALVAVVLAVAGTATPAHAAIAHGTSVAKMTVTPDTKLQSGQTVEFSISEFPANAQVGVVECDSRVISTGDAGYCNSKNYAYLTTSASGAGSGNFTVTAGSAFVSDNDKGVCSQQSSCYIVASTLASGDNKTVAFVEVTFTSGSVTTTSTSTTPTTTPTANASATVTPHQSLRSGQKVAVSVKGFPADAVVTGVQCAEGIVKTGDQGDCNENNVVTINTDGSGSGTGTLVVTSGSAFASVATTPDSVCDKGHFCYLALSSQGSSPEYAFARLYFGLKSTTTVTPAHRTVAAGHAVTVAVTVRGAGGVPSGSVVLREGAKALGRATLSGAATTSFRAKLAPGHHRLTASYAGNPLYVGSSGSTTITVRPEH